MTDAGVSPASENTSPESPGSAAAEPAPAPSTAPAAGAAPAGSVAATPPRDTRTTPSLNADLVLQGGFASGVVYPRAIRRFAEDYRLRSVGGASAGAIGAALGAAAEVGRASGGFERLDGLVDELGTRLGILFVPEPPTSTLFHALIDALAASHTATGRGRLGAVLGVFGRAYRGRVALGALIGILLVAAGVAAIVLGAVAGGAASVTGGILGGVVAIVGGAVIGALLIALLVVLRMARTVTRDLTANGFGMVAGWGSPREQGFVAWIDEQLCLLAGRDWTPGGLTFGDLTAAGLDLRTITTDLSQRRLFELPRAFDGFWFEPDDWRRLFPDAIVDALVAASPEKSGSLQRFGPTETLPVIVAVRMSLSFSGVISAVPLYTVVDGEHVLDWFSDGGIVSNFPVHLFDSPAPRWPTFAIMLTSVDEHFRGPLWDIGDVDDTPREPVRTEIADVASFAHSILGAAMSWYDESYLPLPGYRDRIARVKLRPSEGGLNLTMPAPVIAALAQRGWDAADALATRFLGSDYAPSPAPTGWDHHVWMRHRAFIASLVPLMEGWTNGSPLLAGIPIANPPGVPLDAAAHPLLVDIRTHLDALAATIAQAPPDARQALLDGVDPATALRRTSIL